MTPYYDEDGITIYHGDCREILPTLNLVDVALVLTDPPYGMDYQPRRAGQRGSAQWRDADYRLTGDKAFDPSHLLRFDRLVLWGANYYADRLPPSGGWIVWDKKPYHRKEGFVASDCEMAWTSILSHTRKFSMQWGGEARGGEPILHPTQKPVSLMRWIISEWSNPGDLLLDPYMGSGPVAQACHEMDRRYIGIELEERYCEIAVQRLAQGVLEFS